MPAPPAKSRPRKTKPRRVEDAQAAVIATATRYLMRARSGRKGRDDKK